MAMNQRNNISARMSFDLARQLFWNALRDKFPEGPIGDTKCWEWVNNLVLTQGDVRFEVELNATNNIFQFGVTPNQTNTNNFQFVTEIRLPLQDSICASEIQLFVWKNSSRTAVDALLRTYGNTVDFTAAAAAALDSTFYSGGKLSIKVNNDVIVPQRLLVNWWDKPQTQQTLALGSGSPGDEICGAESGTVTAEPNIVLIGSKQNIIQLELPTNMGTVDAFTRAVIIFKGVYAQNSTIVN